MKSIALKIYRTISYHPWYRISAKWGGYLLKAGITLAALSFIMGRLRAEGADIWSLGSQLDTMALGMLAAAALLMPLNLGFEAAKWQMMVSRFYPELRFHQAYSAVLSGISTGIFTPNRVGEYAGRIMYLEPGRRLESVIFLFVDRICQMGITLWMGSLAAEYFLGYYRAQILINFPETLVWLEFFRLSLWGVSMLGIFLLFFPQVAARLVAWIPYQHPVIQKTQFALEQVHTGLLLKILGLSLARYFIFSFQYFLLLFAFGVQTSPFLIFPAVWLIFLIKSLLPSIALTELGIRESVAIAVLGLITIPALSAFASTFILYVFNIMLPALLGLIFVFRLRL